MAQPARLPPTPAFTVPITAPPTTPALRFALNGRPVALAGRDALRPLSSLLRERLGLTGTKVVCAEGDCGACTVLLGRIAKGPAGPRLDYRPVDACILFAFQCQGTHVVTVEGLKGNSPDHRPHPQADTFNEHGQSEKHRSTTNDSPNAATPLTVIQSALANGHGSQCGFCTPGIVMALHALREQQQPFENDQLRHALSGNLCRCTGYQQIFDACTALNPQDITSLAETYDEATLLKQLQNTRDQSVTLQVQMPDNAAQQNASQNSDTNTSPSQSWLDPDALPTRTVTLHLPATLDDALQTKRDHPDALIVSGATDVGVWHNHGTPWPDHVLSVTALPELSHCTGDDKGTTLTLGASATWETIRDFLSPHFPAFADILDRFGSPQIRQLGTVAGNLANGSPIADSMPFLFVMDAKIETQSADRTTRHIPITTFYTGYKQNLLEPDELITAVHIPKPNAHERLHLEKTSKRRDMDISTFTAAIRLTLNENNDTIKAAAVSLGGVGPTVVRLPDTEAKLAGQPFNETTMQAAGQTARAEIAPISDVRGSANFRFQLAENIFLKAFHEMTTEPATA